MRFVSTIQCALSVIALTLGMSVADAGELVLNGGFEQTTMGTTPAQMDTTNVTDWSTTGYNFIYFPGTADTTGSKSINYGQTYLWGPGGGTTSPQYSANGLPATSPNGGNFVSADGAYEVAPITQTINGLAAGNNYVLTFYWAGAQQSGYNGITTEQWQVSLGSQTLSTNVVTDPSHGFTGWVQAAFIYTATSTSELLSFLAVGTPGGEPPFVLLDGVSLKKEVIAEPASFGIMLFGAGVIGGIIRQRQRRRAG